MYTVLWQEKGKDKWERLETREGVINLLKSLKKNPHVCEDDIWIFNPKADDCATDYEGFMFYSSVCKKG